MVMRNTPAQDSEFRRRQENDRIANNIQQSSTSVPNRQGNTGSSTPGRVARGAASALQEGNRQGVDSVRQWRDRERAGATAGQAPDSADTIARWRSQAPPPAGQPQQTTEASAPRSNSERRWWQGDPNREPRSITMDGNPQGGATPAPVNRNNSVEALRNVGGSVGSAIRDADRAVTRFTDETLGIEPLWGGGQSGQRTPGSVSAREAIRGVNSNAIQSAMDAGAEAQRANRGYYTNRQGERQYVDGTQRADNALSGVEGISVTGNYGEAAQEFARANEIRQQMIDEQSPENQVTIIPDSGSNRNGDLTDRIARLARQASSTSDLRERAGINSEIRALQGAAGIQADQQQADATNQTQLQAQQMRNQGQMDQVLARASMQAMQPGDGQRAYNEARARYQNAQAQALEEGRDMEPPELPDLEALYNAGREDLVDMEANRYLAERDAYDLAQFTRQSNLSEQEIQEAYTAGELEPESRLYEIMERLVGPVENFAMGGLVPETGVETQNFAMGGEVMPPSMSGDMPAQIPTEPQNGPPPLSREYEQYAQGAQQLGVPTVPYEDFVNLMPQAPAMPNEAPDQTQPYGAMGFARGGEIPNPGNPQEMVASAIQGTMQGSDDVSGREVFDPDPAAGTDSIPAIIDGQQPAALDSGEFVIPEHVVRFHGLDKLRKLIAQADTESQNGANGRTESSGSAVRA